jgi:GntR family transcriptional regulator
MNQGDHNMNKNLATIAVIKTQILEFANESNVNGDVKLPSEYALCDMFNVSRSTIREALAQLIQEGIVYRIRGKGAYIRFELTTLRHDLANLFSVTNELKSRGLIPTTKLKYRAVRQANEHVAAHLNIKEGDDYVEIERIRYADGKVAVFNRHHFNVNTIEDATDDDLCGSLFDYWTNSGINISYAKTEIRASVLTKRDIPDLCCELAPFIKLTETYYNDIGDVLCYTIDYYSDEIFSFDLIRRR